jgi:predicted RND superfamily exporter protein
MSKKRNIISSIQTFMDSPKGRTYTNYIYSWGAAIVILGTLFKLTHIAGANLMLFIGMGAEVVVFFFSAFERPYEVAEDEKREEAAEETIAMGGQPIIINGPIMAGGMPVSGSIPQNNNTITENVVPVAQDTEVRPAEKQMMTGGVSPVVIGGEATRSISTGNIEEMNKATEEYVEQIRTLNEAIQRISLQTEALGRNMEEMDTLSRNLTGVNALYEVQLRSAGGQLNAIDQVNEQTNKMAKQIEELNSIYARMIEAMTSNMNRPQI